MSRKTGGIELHGHDGTAAEFVAVLTPLVRLGELGSGRQERSKHASDAEAGDCRSVPAVLVVAEMALMLLIGASLGEAEPFQETRYVFCDGVLNVRMAPRSGAEITGYLFCGDEVTVDDYSKDGAWVHVTGAADGVRRRVDRVPVHQRRGSGAAGGGNPGGGGS